MITTLTLNPAVDKTAIVQELIPGGLNRVLETMQSPGGKGINVSKGLAQLGSATMILGITAGDTGAWIEKYLTAHQIPYDFTEGKGQTRTNLKVFAKRAETITEFNEKGSPVVKRALDGVWRKVRHYAERSEFMVFAGSVPAGIGDDVYFELISTVKSGTKTVLDADGDLLTRGIDAGPYLVKPNIHELEVLFKRTLTQEEEIVRCGRELLARGIDKVLISLGGDGSMLVTEEACFKAAAVKVPVQSTVGAGDSMVAGFLHGLSQGLGDEEAMQLAAACATAAVMTEGSEAFTREAAESLLGKIYVTKVQMG